MSTASEIETVEMMDSLPLSNDSGIVEVASNIAAIKRLSKAEKKALKAEKLKEKRKYNSQQYKARRKERMLIKMQEEPERTVSEQQLMKKSDLMEKLEKSKETGMQVCIDFVFDKEHDERERASLAKQISLSYGIIKKGVSPLRIHLCSLIPDTALEQKLQMQGLRNWKVDIHTESAWDMFPTNSLVFLSPDAELPLETVDQSKVYVIGGIVDRSVRKDRMYTKASEIGAECRRFPIQELIPNRVNHILNVDHCVNILQLVADSPSPVDWISVLESVVPRRKQSNKNIDRNQNSDCDTLGSNS